MTLQGRLFIAALLSVGLALLCWRILPWAGVWIHPGVPIAGFLLILGGTILSAAPGDEAGPTRYSPDDAHAIDDGLGPIAPEDLDPDQARRFEGQVYRSPRRRPWPPEAGEDDRAEADPGWEPGPRPPRD